MKKLFSFLLAFTMLISSVACVSASDSEEKYVYRNNTYEYRIMTDPMHVTDEDFFGKWDPVAEKWVEEPDFDYEKFPDLALVEQAAKEGDYYAAKEAIMAYYTPKKYDKIKKSVSASASDFLEAEKMARNMHATNSTGTSLGIVSGVNEEWQEFSVSSSLILSYVRSAVSTGNPYVSFAITSIDKSNTAAEIKSRDTDAPPTLNLVVNNVQMSFEACGDTYISPMSNAAKNYGNEEILLAQEYGYVGHWDDFTAPWGEEASQTKRTYVKFDISSIISTATVSAASFDFTSRVAPGGDLTEKELFIYGWLDASWGEKSLVWNSFTDWLLFTANEQEAWNYITTSNTGTKGKLCYYHRGSLISPIAVAYDATQEEKYAHIFIRQMMSLVYNVGVNAEIMNALDTSNHIAIIGDSFIRCWGSETMTAVYFTAFLKHFSRMTDYMCTEYLEKETDWNNWGTNQTRSSYWACMKFPEFKNADYWYDCTLRHNYRLYDYGAFDDGVSIEQGIGYVLTWLGTVGGAITVSDVVKNPPYGSFTDEAGAQILLGIVKTLYYSLAPGYGGFDFSDSMDYGVSYKNDIKKWYNYLLDMGIDDPELAYVATDGEIGVLPSFTSISFPDARKTYMRTDWSKNAISMGMTAKGNGMGHSHTDILSVSMYAYGQYLLIDTSYGAVLTGDTRKFMASPPQHNTMTINDGNINKSKGQDSVVKEVTHSINYDYVTYSHAYFVGATNVERSVLFPKNQKFFIISDYIVPEDQTKNNSIKQFWHMLPAANIELTDDGKYELRSNFDSGANVIISPVDVDSLYNISLEDSKYAPAAGSFIDNQKGVYEKKSYGPATLNNVIYPLQSGDDREIQTAVIDTGIADNGAVAFRIKITDPKTGNFEMYYYYHLNDISKKQDVTIGKYKTDAKTMFVQEDMTGKAISFFVYEGSYIEKSDIQDKYLYKSNNGDYTLDANINAGNFAQLSSEMVTSDDLKNITAYVGFDVSAATFNGERVMDSSKDGAYIYFGDTPIVPCTETAPPNSGANGGSSFDSFVGGGGSGGGGGGSAPSTDKDNEDTETTDPVDPVNPVDPDDTDYVLPVVPTYDDVYKEDWHYEYVEVLTSKNILSGDGTGRFNPNNNVTREQFLKMLMLAANVETEEAENTFGDVTDGAWYKEYVLKAKNMGIVNGLSDTEFGIGSNITRQDMAVMIARIIEKLGVEVEKAETADFADKGNISTYARESVLLMKSIGLIEGYNNQFRPLDTLTRAEAAKVICGLMKIVQ